MRYEPNQRSNVSKDVSPLRVAVQGRKSVNSVFEACKKVSSSRQREKNTWNNNEGGSVLNNEGNIPSAVSSTRLETRVDPASRCFAIIIRNNAFISPLRPVLALFYLLSNRHPRVSFLFLSLSLSPFFLIPFHFPPLLFFLFFLREISLSLSLLIFSSFPFFFPSLLSPFSLSLHPSALFSLPTTKRRRETRSNRPPPSSVP